MKPNSVKDQVGRDFGLRKLSPTYGDNMMKVVCVASVVLGLCAAASFPACGHKASDPLGKAVEKCASFDTQTDMNMCSGKLLIAYHKKLDKAYATLIGLVKSSPGTLARVRAQEKAWLKYKSAYMEAAFPGKDKEAEYGTMYPMQSAFLEIGLVQSHMADIQALIDFNEPR